MKRRAAIAANERAGTLRRHECRGDPPHVVERLVRVDHFPVCSPALLVGRGPLTCPDDLAGYPLLHSSWAEGSTSAPGWRMWLRAAGSTIVDPEPGARFGSDSMLVEAALAGQGVALVDNAVVARELDGGELVRPFPPALFEETSFGYHLVHPERHRTTPKVLALREWLLAEVARDRHGRRERRRG